MKKFLHFLLLPAMLFAVAGFVGCGEDGPESNDPEPKPQPTEASLEIASIVTDYMEATVTLKSEACTEYAYEVAKKADAKAPIATILFAEAEGAGRTGALSAETISFTIDRPALSPDTEYVLYVAAKTQQGAFYKEVLSQEFKTKSVGNTKEGLNYIAPSYEGFALYVDVPQSVVDAGNALRWNVVDVFTYYTHTIDFAGRSDAFALLTNGNNKFIYDDTMLVLDNWSAYERDANGNVRYDETDDGELVPATVFDEIVPGQLSYFIIGEFEWAEAGEVLGWPAGYHYPLFDEDAWYNAGASSSSEDQKRYWEGFYDRQIYEAKKPQPMEAKVNVVVDNEVANNARITMTPEEGVQVYCYWVLPNALYLQVSDIINADGDSDVEEDWQWFVTSYAAMWEGAKQSPDQNNDGKPDAVQFNLSDSFYEEAAPTPGVPYHIIVTAIADGGAKQHFTHETIVLPDYTLPAPEVVVTPVLEKTTESVVCFNIKVTNGVGQIAKYFCDSEAMWSDAAKDGYDATSLLLSYGAYFSPSDVTAMNSPEGYDVVIGQGAPFNFDELARIAVQVENLEGQKSPIVMAEVRTKPEPAKTPVDAEYIERLVGDWTISAKVKTTQKNALGEVVWVEQQDPVVSTVTILDQLTYSEAEFENFVKDLPSKGQEEQRVYWTEYKAEADRFNLNLKNQNRLLCLGFDLWHSSNEMKGALELATPWDLFTHPTYSVKQTSDIFRDFGPKWYIEVNADGSMFMPMNMTVFGALSDWYDDYTYYMVGWNTAKNQYIYNDMMGGYAKFPVTLSQDGNTITISGYNYNGDMYYPTPIVVAYNEVQTETAVISEITLTRNAGVAPLTLSANSDGKFEPMVGNGEELPALEAQHLYRRTSLPENLKPISKPYVTQVKVHVPSSLEEMIENSRRRTTSMR